MSEEGGVRRRNLMNLQSLRKQLVSVHYRKQCSQNQQLLGVTEEQIRIFCYIVLIIH